MTTLLIIGAIILLLAVFLWPSLKPQKTRKNQSPNELPQFSKEYAQEFSSHHQDLSPGQEPQLPTSYGSDRHVLLVRDPYWLYAYWEITPAKIGEFSEQYGPQIWNDSQAVLRVYDVSEIHFNGRNAHQFFDYSLGADADNWHIKIPESGRTYCAEIGRLLPDGTFVAILRSNPVIAPKETLSEQVDGEWMFIDGIYQNLKYQPGMSSSILVEENQDWMNRM